MPAVLHPSLYKLKPAPQYVFHVDRSCGHLSRHPDRKYGTLSPPFLTSFEFCANTYLSFRIIELSILFSLQSSLNLPPFYSILPNAYYIYVLHAMHSVKYTFQCRFKRILLPSSSINSPEHIIPSVLWIKYKFPCLHLCYPYH